MDMELDNATIFYSKEHDAVALRCNDPVHGESKPMMETMIIEDFKMVPGYRNQPKSVKYYKIHARCVSCGKVFRGPLGFKIMLAK